MSLHQSTNSTLSLLIGIAVFSPCLASCAAGQSDSAAAPARLNTSETFDQVVAKLPVYREFQFGTAANGREPVRDTADLQKYFLPYGIAGKTVINREWQRYQPFNEHNFVLTASALNLTAEIADGGGLRAGGITSGQIWTRDVFQPGSIGQTEIAISVRMKIPDGRGGWPAVWLYTREPGKNDASEIDNPEFFNETNQNQFDWTGYQHGPGAGHGIYSIMTNKWVWHPGFDFSADFHDYETVWTQDTVYKYVDGKLILAQSFKWTAKGPAQLGIDLAVGTDDQLAFPGLQPSSAAEFPMVLSIQSVKIWVK